MSESQAIDSGGGGGISAADASLGAANVLEGIFGALIAGKQAAGLRADARTTELAGLAESNRRARLGREAIGAGIAIAGASGFTTEHSATDVLAQMAAEAETSAARARWEANGEADKLRFEAKVRKRAGLIGIFTGFVKGASAVASGGGG